MAQHNFYNIKEQVEQDLLKFTDSLPQASSFKMRVVFKTENVGEITVFTKNNAVVNHIQVQNFIGAYVLIKLARIYNLPYDSDELFNKIHLMSRLDQQIYQLAIIQDIEDLHVANSAVRLEFLLHSDSSF